MRTRSDEETAPGDGRARHRHLVQRISGHHGEVARRVNHVSVAVLAQHENLAIVRPWGRGEASGSPRNTLAHLLIEDLFLREVQLLARPGIVHGEKPTVQQREVVIAVDERCRVIRSGGVVVLNDVVITLLALPQ